MADVYKISATEGLKLLEGDLGKELQELKNEIEENEMVHGLPSRPISSVPMPKDVEHFRRERKVVLDRALMVSEAHPTVIQADVMKEEMMNCDKLEYTSDSLPLLLLQHFSERIYQLVQCKHMHMLRWKRFCEHTSTIEALYPAYQKRLADIMAEYHDCLSRTQRLSAARESLLAGNNSASQLVKMDDMVIYLRWLICHLHAVKTFNQFVRLLQWFPVIHKMDVTPTIPDSKEQEDDAPQTGRFTSRYHDDTASFLSRPTSSRSRPSSGASHHSSPIPNPPAGIGHTLLSAQVGPMSSAPMLHAASAAGGGMASDEENLNLPLHINDFESIKPHLNVLVNMYGLSTDVESIKGTADEMELYATVNRKFKQVFHRQETMKTFKIYDRLESGQENWGADHSTHALKQDANWMKFIKLQPERDPHQERQFTQFRQRNNVDELLRVMSKFTHVHDPERVQDTLREHALTVREPPSVTPVFVTSNRTGSNTKQIWKKIYTNPDLFTLQDENPDLQLMEMEEKDTDNVNLGGKSRATSAKKRKDSYDYSTTVQMLGLDDGDQDSGDVASLQGAYLSFLHLRHLRIRDLQRTCLSILNYFRSVERSLTINDGGLSLDGARFKRTSAQNHRKSATELGGVGGGGGLGSHHYLHNTPRDYRISESEFMHFSEVENHDDFYSTDEGRVHVQDQRGYFIMYDAAIKDLESLEQDLLLLATHYIEKDKDLRTASGIKRSSSARMKKSSAGDFDIPSYGHQEVDRFGILLDLWSNEAAHLECKKGLLDCYLEAYHHVFDRDEKRSLAQVITNVMHQRPRFDFSATYFLKAYRMECICLRLHNMLIKNILDKQIEDQREYIHKVTKDTNDTDYGLPHKTISKQPISVNMSRPALRNIFFLEFHPSLSVASRLPAALKYAYWELYHLHKPETVLEAINLEKKMLEMAVKEWDKMEPLGSSFSHQIQKDLFSGIYMEDPQLMTEVLHTVVHEEEQIGKRRTQREKQTDVINTVGRVMELVTLRHRLLDAAWETEILSKVYKKQAVDMGFDECHLFLRFVQFEYANFKENAGKPPPIFITAIQEDDTSVDKYVPSNLYLAIHELDESHVGRFTFRSREGIMQIMKNLGNIQTILMTQVLHKNSLVSAVLQGHGCQPVKPTFIDTKSSGRMSPSETKSEKSSLTAMTGMSSGTQATMYGAKLQPGIQVIRKSPEAFVSLQLEKSPSRDLMLNEFVQKKQSMGMVLKNPEEMEKMKRKLIAEYCQRFLVRVSQYSLRAQIIAYYNSILGLLEQFPYIRDNYFMLGEPNEKKTENDDVAGLTPDARSLKKRPRRLLSPDGKHVLNIWFIPHHSETLIMFKTMEDEMCSRALRYCVQIVAAVHDILQYLCAHAKLGSANARLGKKNEAVSADWGGTEGIGADLREIQKQIGYLPVPTNPELVVEFLTLRRDVMFLEFDASVRISMRNTFLQMGNIQAYKAITNNIFHALPALSNVISPSVLSTGLNIPEPLEPKDFKAKELCPWRTFINNCGPFPVSYWQWQQIEYYVQLCLSGLKEVDRYVANGEILGVTLLMEDVLNSGYLDTATLQLESEDEDETGSRSRPTSRLSRLGGSRRSSAFLPHDTSVNRDPLFQKKTLSQTQEPIESYKLVHVFLLLWRRLEMMKADWGRRKLGVEDIDSVTAFREFNVLYKIEKLFPCLKSIAARHGHTDFYDGIASDSETLPLPPGASEIEIKTKQLVKLCESAEVYMVNEVRRKLLRELNLVLSERAREESALPTDLWKKPAMKESYTINKPHIAEDFKDLLLAEVTEDEDKMVFSRKHLNQCLQQLARDVMERERHNYESYAMYYENLLRSQHQRLYQKEQEVKQVRDQLNNAKNDTMVDVQCLLADQSHELLIEITALRAKIAEMREISLTQERDIRERVKEEYNDLIRNLFSSAFELKTRFDEFRHELHDNVYEKISEARREAIENMTRLKQKSGGSDKDDEVTARQLSQSEKIREIQHENFTLGKLMLKMKTMMNWRQNYTKEDFFKQVTELKKNSDQSKKDYLEIKMLAEEEVILYRQQQVALRKYLEEAEKELIEVKKLLDKELKYKKEKVHTAQQKAQSQKQLEMARAANAEKLLEELEEKELRLKSMEEEQEKNVRLKQITEEKARKDVSQVKKHLNHERSLKLDAFSRVDELQSTLYDFELAASRPETSMVVMPYGGGNRPKSRISSAGVVRKSTSRLSQSVSSTGIWPPPVSFPMNRSITPAPEGASKQFTNDWKKREQFQRPKTVHGQLRSKIAEQLLANIEPEAHQTMITLQTLQL